MATISIIYFSGQGHTARLAEAVATGARSVEGATVNVFPITGEQIVNGRWSAPGVLETLSASDAIIFGSPTYMGGPSAQFKAFADATSGIWFTLGWKDKLAGGFATSGSPAGGKELTLHYMSALAAEHGMIWINNAELPGGITGQPTNQFGYFLGVAALGGVALDDGMPAEGDLQTGTAYGARIANFAVMKAG